MDKCVRQFKNPFYPIYPELYLRISNSYSMLLSLLHLLGTGRKVKPPTYEIYC